MRSLGIVAFGLVLWQSQAAAQTANREMPPAGTPAVGTGTNGTVGWDGTANTPEFTPLTTSERVRMYLMSTFGPGAILKAAASGGIAQWSNTPKEWRGGAEAYGERVGNAFAQQVIRKTLEYGAAGALREDNRYFRSTESGFWKRTKHAVGSTFVARNDAGREHFAYTRFGSALGTAFISRIWQPPSKNTSGDAAENFGITMASDIGWNIFREFRPKHLRRK